jgi:endonuclease G
LLLTFLSSFALAAKTQCPQHYFGGQAPDILNGKLAQKTHEICYQKYSIIHSGITRTPLVSAEHLTWADLSQQPPQRIDKFHPDQNLPEGDRAELTDYEHSEYEPGHMSPAGDMADSKSIEEAFSLANMVPQNPKNNRNLWRGIEEATRNFAKYSGDLYVVTGPIFYGSDLKRLNGRVLVPNYIFKAIYNPSRKQAAAYLIPNDDTGRYAVVSIAEVEKLSGISIFPALDNKVKQSPMALEKPEVKSMTFVEDGTIVPKTPAP